MRTILMAAAVLSVTAAAQAAATRTDFDSAFAAAQAAEKDAGALKNRWTTADDALKAAQKAAAAGDFDTAVKEANNAEALAKASIAQAKEQATAWKAAVIH